MNITFISGNQAKINYLSRFLTHPFLTQKIDLPEIQSLDLKEVVVLKAQEAFARIGAPVLVEDTALTFTGLGLLPGPLVKWFYQSLGNDGLCSLYHKYEHNSATATVMFCLYDGETYSYFTNSARGIISDVPRGDKGFGWDPIFIPHGFSKTWAEMSEDDKEATSLRKPAIQKLVQFLDTKKPE